MPAPFRLLPTAVCCAASHLLTSILLLYCSTPASAWTTIAGWSALALAGLAALHRFFLYPPRLLLMLASCCLALQRAPQSQELQLVEARPVQLLGRLLEWHPTPDGDWALYDRLQTSAGQPLAVPSQRLLALAAPRQPAGQPGDVVLLEGRLQHDGYAFRLDRFRWVIREHGRAPPLTLLRNQVRTRLHKVLSAESAGLALALLLGERRELPDAMQEQYRRFGLVHLLAVSGLHFWLWDQLLRRLLWGKSSKLRWPLLLLAAGLANGSAPVVRACSVVLLRDFSAAAAWPVRGLHLWAAAWAVEICLLPPRLDGLGFALSYTATAFLILGASANKGSLLHSSLRASWVAFLGSMPILHAVQATIEPWTIPLSPLLACLMPLRLLASFVALIPGCGWPMDMLLLALGRFENLLFLALEHVPWSPWVCPQKSTWALSLAALLGLWLCRNWRLHKLSTRCCTMALMLVGFSFTLRGPAGVIALPVGHGLAVVIAGHEKSLSFDLGSGDYEPRRVVERLLIPELGTQHWPLPQQVVLSHSDRDHVNGLPFLARRTALEEIQVPALQSQQLLGFAPFSIRAIGCKPAREGVANDAGHVLEVIHHNFRMVLLGDQSGYSLRQLKQQLAPGPIDILLVPHHGLTTDGLAELLQHLQPKLAWTSSGPRNYPLPVAPLLEYFGIPLRSTLEHPLLWQEPR
jgi:competence protein ComEC